MALVLIAIALMSFAAVSSWASRNVEQQIAANREARTQSVEVPPLAPSLAARKIAPSVIPAASQQNNPVVAQAALQAATENFVGHQHRIQEEQAHADQHARTFSVERDYVQELLANIDGSYTVEAIEKEMTRISSELTESPVLFLRYNRRNQNLNLASVAGEIRVPNYVQMQAYVRKDIELQVEQLADGGKVASLTNYGPINKLIITHLNVAHFEAWGVTSSPDISGQARLVGVLVVLHAGMRSAQVRPTLAKILRESGNYLYAQSNKLKPKSKYEPAISEMSFKTDLS
jgi:hypothetical protein